MFATSLGVGVPLAVTVGYIFLTSDAHRYPRMAASAARDIVRSIHNDTSEIVLPQAMRAFGPAIQAVDFPSVSDEPRWLHRELPIRIEHLL
jgi:hypothetical protein